MPFVSELDQYALTTLEHANYYLGLTSDSGDQDNYIERIINRMSDFIESYCHRKFKARLHVKERHDGKGQELLYFRNYPVLAVNLDGLIWNNSNKTVIRDDGGSFVIDGFKAGDKVLVQNSNKNSGLFTIDTEGVSDDTLTFKEPVLDDTGDNNVILSRFRELWVNDDLMDEDDYEVFKDHLYTPGGLSAGHGNIRITYYAGYDLIPDDLEEVCLGLVKMHYEKKGSISSERLGPYAVTYAEIKRDLPGDIQVTLDHYKRWII